MITIDLLAPYNEIDPVKSQISLGMDFSEVLKILKVEENIIPDYRYKFSKNGNFVMLEFSSSTVNGGTEKVFYLRGVNVKNIDQRKIMPGGIDVKSNSNLF